MTEGKKKENELIAITEAIMSGLSGYLAAELKADDEKEATEIVRRIISALPTPAEPAGDALREAAQAALDCWDRALREAAQAALGCGDRTGPSIQSFEFIGLFHRLRAALAAAPQPEVFGRAENMPLADMARAESFRTLARCIRDPSQPRKMGLPDLAGVLAWEERRVAALDAAPAPQTADREARVAALREMIRDEIDIEYGDADRLARDLLARGLRLPTDKGDVK